MNKVSPALSFWIKERATMKSKKHEERYSQKLTNKYAKQSTGTTSNHIYVTSGNEREKKRE